MNWLCKLGLHDWVSVRDHEYGWVCARKGCTAMKPPMKIPCAGMKNKRRRVRAKLKQLRSKEQSRM